MRSTLHWQDELLPKGKLVSTFLLLHPMHLCSILDKYLDHSEDVFYMNMISNCRTTVPIFHPFTSAEKEDLNERDPNLLSGLFERDSTI